VGDLCAVAAIINQDDLLQHFLRRVLDDAPDSSESSIF